MVTIIFTIMVVVLVLVAVMFMVMVIAMVMVSPLVTRLRHLDPIWSRDQPGSRSLGLYCIMIDDVEGLASVVS